MNCTQCLKEIEKENKYSVCSKCCEEMSKYIHKTPKKSKYTSIEQSALAFVGLSGFALTLIPFAISTRHYTIAILSAIVWCIFMFIAVAIDG